MSALGVDGRQYDAVTVCCDCWTARYPLKPYKPTALDAARSCAACGTATVLAQWMSRDTETGRLM